MSEPKHSETPLTEAAIIRRQHNMWKRDGVSIKASVLAEDMEKLERALTKARLALQAASAALGPMENLINPDLCALKAQIEENL